MRAAILILCAVMILVNILAGDVFAMDSRATTVAKTPLNKLLRGLVNCLTFLVEIPASICDVSRTKGTWAGCTLGVADGLFTSLLRLGTGVFDTATFLIPPYDKPLLKPEYAVESAIDKMGPSADW
jgi:putative exosortase-associated protein (TIGR04073 family)